MQHGKIFRGARLLLTVAAAVFALSVGIAAPGFAAAARPAAAVTPSCAINAATGKCYVPIACTGDGCWGLDPVAAGCDSDAETVGSVTSYMGLLELRYSPACQSNWAKLSNHNPSVGVQFGVENAENPAQTEVWAMTGSDAGSYGWTNMVSGVPLAYAWSEGPDGSDYAWTNWH